ncbi:MAG: 3-oxoadipate enol-lactonase [Rhodospirillales bacterium]
MDFTQSEGARIACRLEGEPGRPVVVLSNSLASDHRMWDPQLPTLMKSFRVLRYDTRGHGASEAPEDAYSIAGLGRDCLAVMDFFGVEKAHFVGLSLGGMTGQWLGAQASQRFHSLTLCDTASEMPSAVWDERIAQVSDRGISVIVETTLERWFTPTFAGRAPDDLARVREMIQSTPAAGYIGCARAIQAMALSPLLARIALPTCIIVGEQDVSTPPSEAEKLHAAIAGSELHKIADSAHLPNIEQADIFNRALQTFLQRQIAATVA